jgi:hypothetical protein
MRCLHPTEAARVRPRREERVARVVLRRCALLDRPPHVVHHPPGGPEHADHQSSTDVGGRYREGDPPGVGLEHAWGRNATMITRRATVIPIRFATTTNSVRDDLDADASPTLALRHAAENPGTVLRRRRQPTVWLVTVSRTRPRRCAVSSSESSWRKPSYPATYIYGGSVRLVIAQCTVDYVGRLTPISRRPVGCCCSRRTARSACTPTTAPTSR